MEKETKRPAVLGDSYDNEPFIANCKWMDNREKRMLKETKDVDRIQS